MTKLIGTGLILVAVTACASHAATTGNPDEGGGPTIETTAPPVSGPVPAPQIDAAALPPEYPKNVTTAGNDLLIKAEEGGCEKLRATVIEQTEQKVAVRLVKLDTRPGEMCPMYIREVTLTVTLDKPLGQRTLVLTAERPK
ncbi:hypothetical protein [Amycolatopsis xylanica]|uniref:hypothetical protein n=1 Tax=Amycolatopsis xylanica TaxID=589385 RepID=UPI00115FE863|nr:hypothetical protein [Amycolatopsis xylanica]